MAGELGKFNIRSNVIRPAHKDTNLCKNTDWSPHAENMRVNEAIAAGRPLRTKLETHHVADLVLFLSGPHSEAITGQEIAVDCGISCA
jgi:NAD(P)-dependent dehydrogenase (short-subunit alcohol dehydrogenase family)